MSYYARIKAVERKAAKGVSTYYGRAEAFKQVFSVMFGREPTPEEIKAEMQKDRKEPTRVELSEIAAEVERMVYEGE